MATAAQRRAEYERQETAKCTEFLRRAYAGEDAWKLADELKLNGATATRLRRAVLQGE